jgi:hypothetical protein
MIFPKGGPAGQMWLSEQKLITIKSGYGPIMNQTNTNAMWPEELLEAGPMSVIPYLANKVQESGAKYAFVGMGALSLPLVGELKRRGITAIHTGGGTQIMFGVKGSRWNTHSVISTLFNSDWVYPSSEEVPSESKRVENACYW